MEFKAPLRNEGGGGALGKERNHALAAVITHFLFSVPVLSDALPELIQLPINLPKLDTERRAIPEPAEPPYSRTVEYCQIPEQHGV